MKVFNTHERIHWLLIDIHPLPQVYSSCGYYDCPWSHSNITLDDCNQRVFMHLLRCEHHCKMIPKHLLIVTRQAISTSSIHPGTRNPQRNFPSTHQKMAATTSAIFQVIHLLGIDFTSSSSVAQSIGKAKKVQLAHHTIRISQRRRGQDVHQISDSKSRQ